MLRVLVLMMAIAAAMPVYADEAPQAGKDDFITGAISDMFNKIGQYTSGEKSVIIEDYENQPDAGQPVTSGFKDQKSQASGTHW